MNLAKSLRDHWLRIDARSLGLFRGAMGIVLLYDLFRRWRYVRDFYSNEGVLPNHNHLFNLRDKADVWSFLHAFSSPGEAHFAFAWILLAYVCFLIGWRTRVFQVLALVCLVSLGSRNILLENAGNYVAVALLAFTLFLPLGSRFSVDSLLRSLDDRDEETAAALNDRDVRDQDAIEAARAPGWSPVSLAAFAVLAQIAIVYLVTAVQQTGAPWRDGTALYYALNVERFASAAGAAARALPPGVLSAWTRVLYASGWMIPALIFVPFAWRITRGVAVALALFYGLTLGVFLELGLYGWTLAAASLLLIPAETWDRLEGRPRPRRARTVIYDADCGVCLWICRVLARLDLRHDLTFQGNDDREGLWVRDGGAARRAELPAAITEELVSSTVVVVGPGGQVETRARAVAAVIEALPLGWLVAWAMRLPGVVHLLGALYDVVAARRQRISVLMGKEACGIPAAGGGREEQGEPSSTGYRDAPAQKLSQRALVPPSTRLRRGALGLLRELVVAVVFWAMLAQTTNANDVGKKLLQPGWLAAVAAWPRMMARWDVLTPAPPTEDEVFVADGQTKGGRSVDPLTGKEPEFDPGAMRGTRLGQLWNDYLTRIHQREWFDFQRAFRDYISKGGANWEPTNPDDQLVGLDAYWVKQPIPPPGEPRAAAVSARDKIFTQSRGGRGLEHMLPLIRPELLNKH
jgi:predicted DCC family thiol-disulfide oxidoreductase YuxK